jgi:hypothetical protein
MIKLSPEAQRRYEKTRAYEAEQKARITNLDDGNLCATARLYAKHMQPIAWPPGAPVYDAVFWNVIVPELVRRLEERS